MNISMDMSSLYSLRQALGIANMRKAMNQDAATVTMLMKGMPDQNTKLMELSVTPHKGSNIDINI